MADEVFRQQRKKITPEELADMGHAPQEAAPLETISQVQKAIAKETGKEMPKPFEASPFEISGNIPPEFKRALAEKAREDAIQGRPGQLPAASDERFETFEAPPERARPAPKKPTPDARVHDKGSDALAALIEKLDDHFQWEEFELPSKGKFYNNIPAVIHVRPMTGEEEQILATPRFVKRGKAIDMIFQRCVRERFDTEQLLSVDRTHLLIYLRGISYTPEYDVEIKCPNCSMKFSHVIDLNDLDVENCPDDFGPSELAGELPASGFRYRYRLATGRDEQELSAYREKRIREWGDQGEDDTLLYRTALLLEEIEGVTLKKEIAFLLKKLPIQDVSHLRNQINQPPFGVDTKLGLMCPSCSDEFNIELPLETSFFFPGKKMEKTQA